MTTQLETARAIWKSLAEQVPALEVQRNKLELLVDVTQNGPPQGKADGTLSEAHWTRMRDVLWGLNTFIAAMRG